MMRLDNMLIIGGASRNVGKTEFVCALIRKFSMERDIVSLKISGINPGNSCHGTHGDVPEKFRLVEETCRDGVKDSSRMLLAGAARAFYLRSHDEFLGEAIEQFLGEVGPGAVIICESIILRKIVKPGLFVIITSPYAETMKRSLGEVIHLADITISSDGKIFHPSPEVIRLDSGKWYLQQ